MPFNSRVKTRLQFRLCTLLTFTLIVMAVQPAFGPSVLAAPTTQMDGIEWLRLSIQNIEAINVTNGEPVTDEIAAGAILASIQGIDQIEYVDLGEFQEGTVKQFDDWVLAQVPVAGLTDVVQVDLSLVEMDIGGGKDTHLSLLALQEYELTKVAMLSHFFNLLDDVAAANQETESRATDVNFGAMLGASLAVGLTSALSSITDTLWAIIVGVIADDPFVPLTLAAPNLAELRNGPINGESFIEDYGAKYKVSYIWSILDASQLSVQAATAQQRAYTPDYPFDEEVAQMRTAWLNQEGEKTLIPIMIAQ